MLLFLLLTFIFVTHDQEEAFVLGDRVAVLNGGCLAQVGTPDDLYRRPADRWVATFVGAANLFRCHHPSGTCNTPVGAVPVLVASDGPADLLLLLSQHKDGQAYIETASLDGETNLKVFEAKPQIVAAAAARASLTAVPDGSGAGFQPLEEQAVVERVRLLEQAGADVTSGLWDALGEDGSCLADSVAWVR